MFVCRSVRHTFSLPLTVFLRLFISLLDWVHLALLSTFEHLKYEFLGKLSSFQQKKKLLKKKVLCTFQYHEHVMFKALKRAGHFFFKKFVAKRCSVSLETHILSAEKSAQSKSAHNFLKSAQHFSKMCSALFYELYTLTMYV